MNEQQQKVYDLMEELNEEILKKALFCKSHNFNMEAQSLNMQYDHGRRLLLEFRVNINSF